VNYLTMAWPVGLVQLSQNPFKKLKSDLHLGNIVMDQVMPKFKSKLESIDVTLENIKKTFEQDVTKKKMYDAVGFTFKDFLALFEDKIRGLSDSGKFRDMVSDISNKKHMDLSQKQKNILEKVTVSAWDIIMAGSGGHKAITNISGLNFINKKQYNGGYVQLIHDIQYEIAKVMKDK
ncbi:hypothetical protein AKJ59_00805, partial [candidate division MSBL1 archaeon SCGC-AAA385M02]